MTGHTLSVASFIHSSKFPCLSSKLITGISGFTALNRFRLPCACNAETCLFCCPAATLPTLAVLLVPCCSPAAPLALRDCDCAACTAGPSSTKGPKCADFRLLAFSALSSFSGAEWPFREDEEADMSMFTDRWLMDARSGVFPDPLPLPLPAPPDPAESPPPSEKRERFFRLDLRRGVFELLDKGESGMMAIIGGLGRLGSCRS